MGALSMTVPVLSDVLTDAWHSTVALPTPEFVTPVRPFPSPSPVPRGIGAYVADGRGRAVVDEAEPLLVGREVVPGLHPPSR